VAVLDAYVDDAVALARYEPKVVAKLDDVMKLATSCQKIRIV
jgi:hypothetical protein